MKCLKSRTSNHDRPKTTDILREIADAVKPMCITTTGELNEAGKHVVRIIIPGEGFVLMEMDEDYAVGLACALVEPFAREKGWRHG